MSTTDPVELIIIEALDNAGIVYVTGGHDPRALGLDFYLPNYDLHIEVKQFHSPRISEQMSRAPNVIAIQGKHAARVFAAMISSVANSQPA